MSDPTLRLVTETDRVPDSFKFERRREPRHRLYARVTAVARPDRSSGDAGSMGDEAGQICALELVDQSASGLGAWSIEPVGIGSRVTVFFPAHGAEPGFNMVGRVVRCAPAQGGYSIGLQIESQMAAA
ncbi:MAG: PilZ domain-containing protein [Planctomycetota bacterium]